MSKFNKLFNKEVCGNGVSYFRDPALSSCVGYFHPIAPLLPFDLPAEAKQAYAVVAYPSLGKLTYELKDDNYTYCCDM